MPQFMAIVCENFANVKEFFPQFKQLGCKVESLKAAFPVRNGVELNFVSRNDLLNFIRLAKGKWEVRSEAAGVVDVTLTPRGEAGHSAISDGMLAASLGRYCKVTSGRRMTYREFPMVENGRRQFRVELTDKALPSLLNFGKAAFLVNYFGQVRTCHKCEGTGHVARDCDVKKCNKCLEFGHTTMECVNSVKCSLCGSSEHLFRKCPESFANKTILGTSWSQLNDHTPGASGKSLATDQILTSGKVEDKAEESVKKIVNKTGKEKANSKLDNGQPIIDTVPQSLTSVTVKDKDNGIANEKVNETVNEKVKEQSCLTQPTIDIVPQSPDLSVLFAETESHPLFEETDDMETANGSDNSTESLTKSSIPQKKKEKSKKRKRGVTSPTSAESRPKDKAKRSENK